MKPMTDPHAGSRGRSTTISLGIPQRLAGATGQAPAGGDTETQVSFAATSSVRRLLDAITASGVDLSEASSAEEIAAALTGLCRQGLRT
jgi:hypothetical protein